MARPVLHSGSASDTLRMAPRWCACGLHSSSSSSSTQSLAGTQLGEAGDVPQTRVGSCGWTAWLQDDIQNFVDAWLKLDKHGTSYLPVKQLFPLLHKVRGGGVGRSTGTGGSTGIRGNMGTGGSTGTRGNMGRLHRCLRLPAKPQWRCSWYAKAGWTVREEGREEKAKRGGGALVTHCLKPPPRLKAYERCTQ